MQTSNTFRRFDPIIRREEQPTVIQYDDVKSAITDIENDLHELRKEMKTTMKADLSSQSYKFEAAKKQLNNVHRDISTLTKCFGVRFPEVARLEDEIMCLKNAYSCRASLKRDAQVALADTCWTSEKEKKLQSLQDQNKNFQDSILSLIQAQQVIEEENRKLKEKLEQSERSYLKKSKELDNLIGKNQTLGVMFSKVQLNN